MYVMFLTKVACWCTPANWKIKRKNWSKKHLNIFDWWNIFFVCEQEAAFRKVVQATMVRDRQHGPVVELNRIQVKCPLIICSTINFILKSPALSYCSSLLLSLSLWGYVPDRFLSITCDVFHKGIFFWCVCVWSELQPVCRGSWTELLDFTPHRVSVQATTSPPSSCIHGAESCHIQDFMPISTSSLYLAGSH